MLENTHFFRDIILFGSLDKNTVLIGKPDGDNWNIFQLTLQTGQQKKVATYSRRHGLYTVTVHGIYFYDQTGEQDTLVCCLNDTYHVSKMPASARLIPHLGDGAILCIDNTKNNIQLLDCASHKEKWVANAPFPVNIPLKSTSDKYIILTDKLRQSVTLICSQSGTLLWTSRLAERDSIHIGYRVQLTNDALIFYGCSFLTGAIPIGNETFSPKEAGEEVKVMFAIDIDTGNLRWKHPLFGIQPISVSSAKAEHLISFNEHVYHTLDASVGTTVKLVVHERGLKRKHRVQHSTVFQDYAIGITREGCLLVYDLKNEHLIQESWEPWQGQGAPLKKPIIVGDNVIVYDHPFDERLGFISVYRVAQP